MTGALHLPPLFEAHDTAGSAPLEVACARARAGCDAGLVAYDLSPDLLRAAIVFAPEVPLRDAAIMLPICGVGFQNALGALSPPEVSVHLDWSGAIRLNGGVAGKLTISAAPTDPSGEPDWLVIALDLTLWPDAEDTGLTPDVTALVSEGCGEVSPPELLEAWVRHTLVWINRWLDDGPRPVHNEWQPLAHGLKSDVTQGAHTGTFVGVDENFGMILQSKDGTTIIPLTDLIKDIP